MKLNHNYLLSSGLVLIAAAGGLLFGLSSDRNEGLLAREIQAIQQSLDENSRRVAQKMDNLERSMRKRTRALERRVDDLGGTARSGVDLQQARIEIDQLKEALATLGANAHLSNWDDPGVSAEDSLSQAAPEPDPEQIEELRQQKQEAQVSLFNSVIENEPQDPEWSAGAKEQLLIGMAEAKDKVTVDAIECATSLCRLETTSPAGVDGNDVFRALDEHAGWDGEIFMTVDHDSGQATAYLGRPGNPLPRAEEQL